MKIKHKAFFTGMLVTLLTFGLVFAGCSKKNLGGKANPASDFSYDLTADGKGILIKGYTGGPGSVVIPAKIEDMPVLEIGNDAFNGKTITFNLGVASKTGDFTDGMKNEANDKAGITSITIPNTVTKIGTSAFANTAITSIVIPDSVTEIAFDFVGSSNLFSGCEQLTEIRFSDNLEILPGYLGGYGTLKALKKINLPKKLKYIGAFTFDNAGELAEIVIPSELTSMAFFNKLENSATDAAVEKGVYYSGYYATEFRILKVLKQSPDTAGDDPKYPKGHNVVLLEDTKNSAFAGCGKLPIKTRQTIQGWGYTGTF